MRWKKLGKVYGPDGKSSWARHSALTPTPWLRDEETIRVFAGFRDDNGVSRIGWVDLDSADPLRVKGVSSQPALDLGRPGAFDDNGVILGDIIEAGNELRLYYVGFQQVAKAKFLAFTGLAVSIDRGDSFVRVSDAPVMDRCHGGIFIRAIHSVHHDRSGYRVWFAVGDGWEMINGTQFPRYHIRTIASADGLSFPGSGELCLDVSGDEYRIGRPRVFKYRDKLVMHFTAGTRSGTYMAGYADSTDGVNWRRADEKLGLALSPSGWDSRHLCYPAVVEVSGQQLAFYNGNDMGKEGFGCAVLEED